jgi:hypothetical protein
MPDEERGKFQGVSGEVNHLLGQLVVQNLSRRLHWIFPGDALGFGVGWLCCFGQSGCMEMAGCLALSNPTLRSLFSCLNRFHA